MGSKFEFRIANFELMKGARRFERGSRNAERGIEELENS